MILYTFVCEHGKTCNFIADCQECAKAKIKDTEAKLKIAGEALNNSDTKLTNITVTESLSASIDRQIYSVIKEIREAIKQIGEV